MPATTPRPPSSEQVAAFDRTAWSRSIGIPGRNPRNPQFEGAQRDWLGHADIRSLRAGAASNRLQISPFFGRIAGIRSAFYFTPKRRFLAVGRPRPFRHRATRQCSGLFEPTDVSDSNPNPPIPGCGPMPCRRGEQRSLCALDPYFHSLRSPRLGRAQQEYEKNAIAS
jgi:hypothetical protein